MLLSNAKRRVKIIKMLLIQVFEKGERILELLSDPFGKFRPTYPLKTEIKKKEYFQVGEMQILILIIKVAPLMVFCNAKNDPSDRITSRKRSIGPYNIQKNDPSDYKGSPAK